MNIKEHLSPTNIVAILILLVGGLRLIFGDGDSDRFGETTLLYFFGAAAVFLLARAKTFKFGDLELELQQLKGEVQSARLEAGIAEDAAKLEMRSVEEQPPAQFRGQAITPGHHYDDPWKGVFGGSSIDTERGRMLSAKVDPLTSQPGWYSVTLTVTRTAPDKDSLTGPVQFFLHDTFRNNRPVVEAVNDQATIRLKAWGAFTVGALCDQGQCKLELDMAMLENAPMEFRTR